MGKYLSSDEQKELFIKYKQGDLEARKTLIETNLCLVSYIIKKFFYDSKEDYEDLFQYGCEILIRCIDNYDLNKNVNLTTYTYINLKYSLNDFLLESGLVRINHGRVRKISEINKFKNAFFVKNGRYPCVEEISMNLNLSIEYIKKYLTERNSIVYFEDTIDGEDKKFKYEKYLIDEKAVNPCEYTVRKITLEEVTRMLADLNENEKNVIMMRYGLNDGIFKTLEEIGQELGVTRERIRQIETKALLKLKNGYKNNGVIEKGKSLRRKRCE